MSATDPQTVGEFEALMDEIITELGRAIGADVSVDMSDPRDPKMTVQRIPASSERPQELYDESLVARDMIERCIELGKVNPAKLGLRRKGAT
jgi:hypothetical protein